jgi:signal peptidase II
MKKNIYALMILAAALACDIVTKHLIVRNFSYFDRLDYLGGFLRITLVYNEGGVFGILQGYKNMFLVVSLLVLAVMVGYYAYEYIYRKNRSMIFSAAMALIVSGAIGNIIDRLISHRPGVVDFISIGVDGVYRWPTFNVADSCIVAGAALLIIVFYREEKRHREAKEAE